MQLKLAIANKNYSSWSMRPWVLMRAAGVPFEELQFWFDENDQLPKEILAVSPTGKVPCLVVDGAPVWESLAICETLAELFPEQQLWPRNPAARRFARAIASEMHAGFGTLRSLLPMNLKVVIDGQKVATPALARDLARVDAVWHQARAQFGQAAQGEDAGPYLFGRFSVADAMYAPVAMRLITGGFVLSPLAQAYREALAAHPAVVEWVAGARLETGSEPGVDRYYAALA
jgi:glutathione S-transferase